MKKRNSIKANKREYHKIGRLAPAVAKRIGVIAGNIMIDSNAIEHIFKRHEKQLQQLGLTPELFVKMVLKTFNQIYEGKEQRLLLVCKEDTAKYHNTVVIGLVLNRNKDKTFWEVVTVSPRNTSFFKNKVLIYEKKR